MLAAIRYSTTPMLLFVLATVVVASPVVHHEAYVSFDIEAHTFSFIDEMIVPAGVDTLCLGADLQFRGGEGDFVPEGGVADDAVLSYILPGAGTYRLAYSGTAFQSTEGVVFSRENVGNEISATVAEEGIYLSGGACLLPYLPEALSTWNLTVDTPAGFVPVTQGRRVSSTETDGRLVTVFEIDYPTDGLNLIAQRYEVATEVHEGVTISVCLLESDERLSKLYLERTRVYLDMYTGMVGPYPYDKFTTVENWFPTGYGMPGWTLLGGMVMRLPFIPYTSFGHEICHNWWGNSVFVDAERGNWCEGLTSYCADYHYKELESVEAAREYRRNTLKSYAAYVRDEDQDFPLVEFKSRHSGATRAVGYGKSMMIFHMIDDLIGREAFLEAMRAVYAERKFEPTGWGDWLAAFGAVSGRDFTDFGRQWLEGIGAPAFVIDEAEMVGDTLHLRLSQLSPSFDVDVPVVVTTDDGVQRHVLRFEGPRGVFEIEAPGATRVAVDPDYDIFRRLHPLEIEATIAQVLAEEVPYFVLPAAAETEVAAARQFAVDYTHLEEPTLFHDGRPPYDLRPGTTCNGFLLNPPAEILQGRLPAGVTVAGDYLFLEGKRYSLQEYDFVAAAYNPEDRSATDLVVVSRSTHRLPSIAGRIQHYGKYSWLLLPAGHGRALRGNWQPEGDPLAVDID